MANAMGITKIYDPTGEDKSKGMISDINYFSAKRYMIWEYLMCRQFTQLHKVTNETIMTTNDEHF